MSSGARVEQRFYKSVVAGETDQSDYVIPDGKILNIYEIGGNSTYNPSSRVEIIWDPVTTNELLFLTSGDSTQKSSKKFTGDGVKIVRIKLTNTDIIARYMGGYFLGKY